jgi:ankyrin repeat protein
MLLNAGADVNQTICVRQEALTALHVCASRGNIMSTLLLLQYGAKVNVKDVSGRTPKEMIVCHQPERFLELLEFYAGTCLVISLFSDFQYLL